MGQWEVFKRPGRRRGPGYRVELQAADRARLVTLTRTGAHPVRQVARARILLALDVRQGPVDPYAQIAERVGMCVDTITSVAKAFVETGGDIDAVICRKKRLTPPVPAKVTGDVEARIIAKACGKPPDGYTRWTLRLLEKHVRLDEDLPDLDHTTIGRVLKKTNFALT